MKFFQSKTVPECPIIKRLQHEGKYLNIPPACDRVEYRSLRPKAFGVFPTPCCKHNTCLITMRTMGERTDAKGNRVPLDAIKVKLAEYHASQSIMRKVYRSFIRNTEHAIQALYDLWKQVESKSISTLIGK